MALWSHTLAAAASGAPFSRRHPLLSDTPPPYPHRCGRRLEKRGQVPGGDSNSGEQAVPGPPTAQQAAAVVTQVPHGVFSLLRTARLSNKLGDHRRAYRAAALAAVAEPQDADVQEAAAAAQKAAIQGSVVAAWSAAIAAESALQEARELKHAAVVAARNARRASSLPKARQGLNKPIMRLLHVRLCCACRALRPRALMWRVMQLRPRHAVAPKPERKRKIRRRWVLPKQLPTEPFVPDSAAVALHNKIRLARLPGDAPELVEAQADEAVWTSERIGARSVYVCRTKACVAYAARKKGQAMARGLGASVPLPVLEALQAANEVACRAAGGDRADDVGLPEHIARLIEAHMPRVPPVPPSTLKGAYDRWTAPPSGPK